MYNYIDIKPDVRKCSHMNCYIYVFNNHIAVIIIHYREACCEVSQEFIVLRMLTHTHMTSPTVLIAMLDVCIRLHR